MVSHIHLKMHCSEVKWRAVAVIELWWWRMRSKKVFRILTEAIRSAVSNVLSLVIDIVPGYILYLWSSLAP